MARMKPPRMPSEQRDAIEQGVARGEPPERISAALGVPLDVVEALVRYMDAAAAEPGAVTRQEDEARRRAEHAKRAELARRRAADRGARAQLETDRAALRARRRAADELRAVAAEETASVYAEARCQTRGRVLTLKGEKYAVREAVGSAS